MSPSLKSILTPHDIERIHSHSLDILERVGIEYKTPKALQILEERGCPVNYEQNRARLPSEVVEWALSQAPRVVRLEARDSARDVLLVGQNSDHCTDSHGAKAINSVSSEGRESHAEDLRSLCAAIGFRMRRSTKRIVGQRKLA